MPRIMISAALVAALLSSPAWAESRTMELPAFTAVDISSGLDAKVSIGPQAVTVEARNAADLDELELYVENGVLKAHTEWDLLKLLEAPVDRDIRLTISAPALTGVTATAGSDVEAAGIAGDELTFKAFSGADLTLTAVSGKIVNLETAAGADLNAEGTCETGRAKADAGASLSAVGLKCADMTVSGAAGSDIEVFASKSVKADALAGASITVSGKPARVEQSGFAGGDVTIEE